MCAERALAASLLVDHSQKRGHNSHTHCSTRTHPNAKFGTKKNTARHPFRSKTSTAHAANGTDIVCFNCDEPGHITPKYPKGKQKGQPVRPAACGNSASSTTTQGNNSPSELICIAKAIHLEQAFIARCILDYNVNPTLPQP